jgi:hypothetical protein
LIYFGYGILNSSECNDYKLVNNQNRNGRSINQGTLSSATSSTDSLDNSINRRRGANNPAFDS